MQKVALVNSTTDILNIKVIKR